MRKIIDIVITASNSRGSGGFWCPCFLESSWPFTQPTFIQTIASGNVSSTSSKCWSVIFLNSIINCWGKLETWVTGLVSWWIHRKVSKFGMWNGWISCHTDVLGLQSIRLLAITTNKFNPKRIRRALDHKACNKTCNHKWSCCMIRDCLVIFNDEERRDRHDREDLGEMEAKNLK